MALASNPFVCFSLLVKKKEKKYPAAFVPLQARRPTCLPRTSRTRLRINNRGPASPPTLATSISRPHAIHSVSTTSSPSASSCGGEMAVQAQQQCLSHAFLPHHDLAPAFGGGGLLLDALGVGGGCAGGIGDAVVFAGDAQQPRSELTCTGTDAGFVPRKRARLGPPAIGGGLLEYGTQQGLAVLPPAVQHAQVFAGDVQSRTVGCGAASTSGRAAAGGDGCLSQGALAQFYHHDMEIDDLVRLEMECMRLGLQELRQRQTRAVVAAAERAAASRLRAAEAELERARCRNAELEDRLRQLTAEGQAWLGVARSHEAVAAGLRATLDQLLLQQPVAGNLPAGGADAEDAQSCCFETAAVSARRAAAFCRACRGAEACVLVLPCRHLCLCRACEAVATTCPVCAATKNASLQVLLS